MDERGEGNSLTDEERAARHFNVTLSEVTPEMIEELPERGTGLETGRARGTDGSEIDTIAIFLLAHSMPHMEGSPGIVVNPDVATRTPCRCAKVGNSEICFSKGVIGGLDEGQKEAYCNPKNYYENPDLEERIAKFKEAVAAAQEKVKNIPKGERLGPWLSAMSQELQTRGIEV